LNFSLDPVEVGGLPGNATSITAAVNTVCATFGSGDVYCWGDSRYGQGGNKLSENFIPVKIALNAVSKVSTSGINTCGVSSGEVYCWGHSNAYYTVSSTWAMDGTPNKTTLKSVSDLSMAQYMLCVVGASGPNVGTCHGYGVNLGTLSTTTPFVAAYGSEVCYIDGGQFRCRGTKSVFLDNGVKSSSNPLSVAGGNTCWITSKTGTDQLLCAGANYSNPGTMIADVSGPKKAVSAPSFQCVLETSGQAKCWGSNALGQLGNGTRTNSALPVLVGG
jgi:serine/threonine-protein kinase